MEKERIRRSWDRWSVCATHRRRNCCQFHDSSEGVVQDRVETAKIRKFQKRVETEEDEDIKNEVLTLLQKVTESNQVTKGDVLVFKGKIRKVVEDLCRSHNAAILAADSEKRKAAAETLSPNPAQNQTSKKKKRQKRARLTLSDAADLDDEGVSSPPERISSRAPPAAPTAPSTAPPKAPIPSPKAPTPSPRVPTSPPSCPNASYPTTSSWRSYSHITPPPEADPEAPEADVIPEADAAAPDAEPAARDFSPARTANESEAPAAEANASPEGEEEVQILNLSQELALTAAKEAGPSNAAPSPRQPRTRTVSRSIPVQDTQLNSNYPRETFPIFLGASSSRHGPLFDVERHRSKLSFFGESPYSKQRTADDLHFWTTEQQILYTKVFCQKDMLFHHRYLDLRSLSSATCFQNIVDTISSQNLVSLFALRSTFNSELIKQFYATLYVSGKANDTNTWILEWMIQGQVFRMSSQEFMEIVNIPRHTGSQDKIHFLPEMIDGEFASLLDPEVTEDHMPENIRPKHLVFISKTWFYILSKSLLPLSNAHEESNI